MSEGREQGFNYFLFWMMGLLSFDEWEFPKIAEGFNTIPEMNDSLASSCEWSAPYHPP